MSGFGSRATLHAVARRPRKQWFSWVSTNHEIFLTKPFLKRKHLLRKNFQTIYGRNNSLEIHVATRSDTKDLLAIA